MSSEQQTQTETMAQDQARMELAMAAAATERANKPRGLVILAGLLLAGSLIYALMGLSARSATLSRVANERNRTLDVIRVVDRVKALQNQQATRGLAADPRVAKSIEELAAAAGVKADASGKALVVPESEVTGMAVPGIAQKKYTARVSGQDPKALLEWLVNIQSSSDTRGVEIFQLTLQPDAAGTLGAAGGWTMNVEFVRWESR